MGSINEGVMFADDICVFSRTETHLQELMDNITEWGNIWEMTIDAPMWSNESGWKWIRRHQRKGMEMD